MTSVKPQRKQYLDLLRVIAMTLVLFNHTPGFSSFQYSQNPVVIFLRLILCGITYVNVPLFLMITGALILSRDISYGELFRKRIPRFLILIILITLFHEFVYLAVNGEAYRQNIGFSQIFYGTFSGSIELIYWYLYAYFGLLLMYPFLRKITSRLTFHDGVYLILLHCAFNSLLPLCNYILGEFGIRTLTLSKAIEVTLATSRVFYYPLLGYWLDHCVDIRKLTARTIRIVLVCMAGCLCIQAGIACRELLCDDLSWNYLLYFPGILTPAVFLLVKYLFIRKNMLADSCFLMPLVTWISNVSLGIYLLDPIFKTYCYTLNIVPQPEDGLLLAFGWCILSIACCGAFTWLLKKLPGIGKLL